MLHSGYNRRTIDLESMLALCLMLVTLSGSARAGHIINRDRALAQESFPAPPADRTLIYVKSEKGELTALPFETGQTPLHAETPASRDRMSRVELKGEHAAASVANDAPRFYLFVPDQSNAHPPLLVLLTPKRGARHVTVVAQKGQRGFAVASEEIIKPHYRVIAHDNGMLYMEVWPREPLLPGEYAFIGSDLARVATFSVKQSSTP